MNSITYRSVLLIFKQRSIVPMIFYSNRSFITATKAFFVGLVTYFILSIDAVRAESFESLPQFTCGFVEIAPKIDARADRLYPAAILQTVNDGFLLFTQHRVSPDSHNFYYKDGETEFTASAKDLLFAEPEVCSLFCRDLAVVYRVPLEDLDSDLLQVVLKCAVHEDQFVTSSLGKRTAIVGQSHSIKTPPFVSLGIIAGIAHEQPGTMFLPPKYDLILPQSAGASAFSWVYSLENEYFTGQPKILGLLIDHVAFKKGDGFLNKETLFEAIAGKPLLNNLEKHTRQTHCVWLSNLAGTKNLSDNWRPAGFVASGPFGDFDYRMDRDKAVSFFNASGIGFPGGLFKCDTKTYLVFRDSKKFRLRLNSRITAEDKSGQSVYQIKSYFEPTQEDNFISIGEGLSALPALTDKELPLELSTKVIDLDRSYPHDFDCKVRVGLSIPRSIFDFDVDSLEESIVYSMVANPESSPPSNLTEFDSEIYPALVFDEDGRRKAFAGVLGSDSASGKSKLYTPDDLRAALTKVK